MHVFICPVCEKKFFSLTAFAKHDCQKEKIQKALTELLSDKLPPGGNE